MADFSGFTGLPSEQLRLDNQAQQLNALTLQQKAQEMPYHLEALKSQIADHTSLAKFRAQETIGLEIKNKQAQLEADALQKMMQQEQQSPAAQEARGLQAISSGEALADKYIAMGETLLNGGAPVLAKKYIDEGLAIKVKTSQATRNQSQKRSADITAAEKEIDLTSRYLGGAKTQAEWEAGKTALLSAMPDIPKEDVAKLMSLPFNEATQRHINDMAVSEKDKQRLAREAAEAESRDRERRDKQYHRNVRDSLDTFRAKEEIRRDVAEQKAGGKPMKDIPQKMLDRSRAAVERAIFPDGAVPEAAKNAVADASLDVVGQVQSMMRANRGMTESEALTRAVAANQKDWSTIKGSLFTKDKRVYTGGGKTPETALALPAKKEEAKEGKYYNVNGAPHLWNGKVFVPAKAKVSAASSVDASEDDDE